MHATEITHSRGRNLLYLLWRWVSVSVILFVFGWLAYRGMSQNYTFEWGKALRFFPRFYDGLNLTLQVSLAGGLGATLLGLIVALGRLSPWAVIRDLAGTYVHTLRNLPFIVVMLIFFFGLRKGIALSSLTVFGHTFEAPFVWGSVALAFYESSYMAEIIRSGIQAVHVEQMEAARSLGMTYLQAMRYVILPQAFKVILPPSTGVFIGMVKESALLSIIGLPELTRAAVDVLDPLIRPYFFEIYLMLAGYYLAIVVPLSFLSQWLEGRLGSKSRLAEEAARGL